MTTADTAALCAALVAQARGDERIEVFARRVRTVMTRLGSSGQAHDQISDGWMIGVRSSVDDRLGLATGNVLDERGLATILADARRARVEVPRPVAREDGHGQVAASPAAEPVHGSSTPAQLRAIAAAVHRDASAGGPAVVTVGSTRRVVVLHDSAGRSETHQQTEAQLHIRSATRGLDAAQGARIRRNVTELPIDGALAEYTRSFSALTGSPAPSGRPQWILLSPLLVARIVGRISRAFLRNANRAHSWKTGDVIGTGRQKLVLVDDGAAQRGPGAIPVDDEGVARRRTVLLDRGRVAGLLGCTSAGPSTGSAQWGGWDSEILPATAACYVEPTTEQVVAAPESLPGDGFVAEDLRGFRGGLDFTTGRIECELTGVVMRDGKPVGTGRIALSAAPGEFLGAFDEVYSGTEFYRIQGLHGGSWCLLNGSVVHGDC
ncbi:hypothetical protein GCM10010430_13670 [Kitasatospora cystarginea]|uniref:Metalloprotease TldD/E C-terminal domain-containing protein n=1 Tax=Kitasatospora cystarginea TaxID=58350 RepID=A0ABN3DK91_9ACTN